LLHKGIIAAGVFAMVYGTGDTLHRIVLEYAKDDNGSA